MGEHLAEYSYNPVIVLGRGEQAALAATVATPGYRILHRIHRAEVDKFIMRLINQSGADKDEVLAAFDLAKAAAMFYEATTTRVNEEVANYTSTETVRLPEDVTEGVLDIGERASTVHDFDSFLGEEDDE